MKKLALVIVLCASALAMAAEAPSPRKELTPEQKAENLARIKQKYYENTGGRVVNPMSGSGKIVFVNAQARLSAADVTAIVDELAMGFSLRMSVVAGEKPTFETISTVAETSGGATTIFIVDDPVLPMSLVSYEARWAIVNVAKIADEAAPEKFNERIHKELARSFALVSGVAYGVGTAGLMGPVKVPSGLDLCNLPERVNPNLYTPIHKYLANFGVMPTEVATYRKACKDGWAPAPTNDVQKAIWDKEQEKKAALQPK